MILLAGLPESSCEWVRSFPQLAYHHHGSPHSHITWGWTTGPLVATVLRHKSHPININQSVIKHSPMHSTRAAIPSQGFSSGWWTVYGRQGGMRHCLHVAHCHYCEAKTTITVTLTGWYCTRRPMHCDHYRYTVWAKPKCSVCSCFISKALGSSGPIFKLAAGEILQWCQNYFFSLTPVIRTYGNDFTYLTTSLKHCLPTSLLRTTKFCTYEWFS
jgi:hypothetical protein